MNDKLSMAGKYRAKVIDHQFGYAGQDNKPQVALMFEIQDEGPLKGRTVSWFGFFTDSAKDRTFDSLRYCGWDSDDLEQLDGVTRNEVEIVVEEEIYNGAPKVKVRWVNRAAKRNLDLKNKMDPNALKGLAEKLKADAAARRREEKGAPTPGTVTSQKKPRNGNGYEEGGWQPPDDDDRIPF